MACEFEFYAKYSISLQTNEVIVHSSNEFNYVSYKRIILHFKMENLGGSQVKSSEMLLMC